MHLRWKARSPTASTSSIEQDLRLEVGGDGEGQPHIHAARVALDRRVDEPVDLGERDDLVELASDLAAAHAEDRAVEVDVLPAGQLGVEAGADLQQAADPARGSRRGRSVGSVIRREDLQQRALAGAVAADDADHLARLHLEARVLEGPKHVPRRFLGSRGPSQPPQGS